jgi:hypothetical protein
MAPRSANRVASRAYGEQSALTGFSLHCSSHRWPLRHTRWKWSPLTDPAEDGVLGEDGDETEEQDEP